MTTISSGGYNVATMIQQATSTTTSTSLPGISGLLQGAVGTSGGIMGALSGSSTTTNSVNVLSALPGGGGSSGSSIQSILNQQKVTAQTNSIYANVAAHVTALQNGQIQPTNDWEKVTDYAAQTGQPVVITLDSKGQVQALPQSQADLSKYNIDQQQQIQQAISDVSTMAQKIQANAKNTTWLNDLAGAANDLSLIHSDALQAQSSWEQQGSLLMTEHQPFKISLDSTGNLQITEQATDPMTDLSPNQQKLLRAAVQTIPKMIRSDTPTTSWQIDAQSYDKSGTPYYLDIDPVTNQISAKENSAANITPDFMKTPPYPDIGDKTPLLKQAAAFIQKKQAFFLDIDTTGKVVAKALTATNLQKYNTTTDSTSSNTQMTPGSYLSIYA